MAVVVTVVKLVWRLQCTLPNTRMAERERGHSGQSGHSLPVGAGFTVYQEPFEPHERPFALAFDDDPMKLMQPREWAARQRQELEATIDLEDVIMDHAGFRRVHEVEHYGLDAYESASVLCFVYDKNNGRKKFLMGAERRGWSNLGGRREPYEYDAAVTAMREMCEESRYQIDPPRSLRLVHYSRGHAIYAGELENEPDLAALNRAPVDYSTEKTEYGWIYGRDILMALFRMKRQTGIPMPAELESGRSLVEVMQVMSDEFRHVDPSLLVEPKLWQSVLQRFHKLHPKPLIRVGSKH